MFNFELELVKAGHKQSQIPKMVAEAIKCNEKTARNKISGKTAFTMPEAAALNTELFSGKQSLDYLFSESTGKTA